LICQITKILGVGKFEKNGQIRRKKFKMKKLPEIAGNFLIKKNPKNNFAE